MSIAKNLTSYLFITLVSTFLIYMLTLLIHILFCVFFKIEPILINSDIKNHMKKIDLWLKINILFEKLEYFIDGFLNLIFFIYTYIQIFMLIFHIFKLFLILFKFTNGDFITYISLTIDLIVVKQVSRLFQKAIFLLYEKFDLKHSKNNGILTDNFIKNYRDNFIKSINNYYKVLKPNLLIYLLSVFILFFSNVKIINIQYSSNNTIWSVNSAILTFLAIERIENYILKNKEDFKQIFKDFISNIPK